MDHVLSAKGFHTRFRPVRAEDAAFIVWLRNQDRALGRVGDSLEDVHSQEAWLEEYFQRPGDLYFIIETAGGIPLGSYGVYGLKGDSAEVGRWILRPGTPAALPSVMLALDLCFRQLKLARVRARTVAENHSVLSIHRKIGFRPVWTEPQAQRIGGRLVDLVHSVMDAQTGLHNYDRLLPLANWTGGKVLEWERSHPTATAESAMATAGERLETK
jgi:RimJ/RimL family protein N-acetyltransferase